MIGRCKFIEWIVGKVFVKDCMPKRKKKCRFYLFDFLDYQINYYEV